MLYRASALLGFVVLVTCRTPPQATVEPARFDFDDSHPTPVEVRVRSDDEDLRRLVAACFSIRLRHSVALTPVATGGKWRIEVDAEARQGTSEVPSDSIILDVRVVDCSKAPDSTLESTGHPTDSAIGDTLTCGLDQVWTTTSNIVNDVEHVVRMGWKAAEERLRLGETDLVDDKSVRSR